MGANPVQRVMVLQDRALSRSRPVPVPKIREVANQSTPALHFTDDLFVELLPAPSGNPRFPTLFTRIPMFAVVRFREKLDTTDWQKGTVIETQWGKIRRFGPGLDIYDEDTLIAMFHLCRQKCVTGEYNKLPIPFQMTPELIQKMQAGASTFSVIVGETTAYQINRFLGRPTGGKGLRDCRASIWRLNITQFYVARERGVSETKKFFSLISKNDLTDASDLDTRVIVQFNPDVATWLSQSFTYIDLDVRRQLTDLGKALHKFLTSQDKPIYVIYLKNLTRPLGYDRELKYFKRDLVTALTKLKELKWLKSWKISGTGRSTDFMLQVVRHDAPTQQ